MNIPDELFSDNDDTLGAISDDHRIIIIFPKKHKCLGDMLTTFMHEWLHYTHSDWTEEMVEKKMDWICDNFEISEIEK